MKKLAFVTSAFVFAFILVAGACAQVVSAQTASSRVLVDHWAMADQCLAATSAPFYRPSILQKKKLGKNEIIRGIPYAGCYDMDLPDRLGGRGYVKLAAGTLGVYNAETRELLRLAECNNTIYHIIPFEPLHGAMGPMGPQGLRGEPGPQGLRGEKGDTGEAGRVVYMETPKKGFPWKKVAIIGGVVGGVATGAYAKWYYSCPPGTTRRR